MRSPTVILFFLLAACAHAWPASLALRASSPTCLTDAQAKNVANGFKGLIDNYSNASAAAILSATYLPTPPRHRLFYKTQVSPSDHIPFLQLHGLHRLSNQPRQRRLSNRPSHLRHRSFHLPRILPSGPGRPTQHPIHHPQHLARLLYGYCAVDQL